MNFYNCALCHVCKKAKANLQKCGNCRMMYYCSRKHQIQDWPFHKDLCKLITEISKDVPVHDDLTAYEFNQRKIMQMCMMCFLSSKSLEKFNYQIWMYPRVCDVCFSREVTIVCQGCLNVAYCSEAHKESHKEKHAKFCAELKLFLDFEKQIYRKSTKICVDYRFKRDIRSLPETMELVLRAMDFKNKTIDLSGNSIDLIMMTDFFSTSITIIQALEKAKFIENRRGRKTDLIIHAVYPSLLFDSIYFEVLLEYLSHWIINLKHAGIFQIAPDRDQEEESLLIPSCDICRKKRFIGITRTLCAEYDGLVGVIPEPDLIVLFKNDNFFVQDFHQGVDRSNISKQVLYKEVPVLLTCYTQRQINQSIATLPPSNIKFFMDPQVNEYASQRPIRNWEVGLEPVLYPHKYISVFSKQRVD